MFSLSPLQIQLFTLGFSFFSTILVLIILLSGKDRSRTIKSFILALLPIIFWGFSGFITTTLVMTGNIKLAVTIGIIAVMSVPLMTLGAINFIINFYKDIKKPKKTKNLYNIKLVCFLTILLELILLSDLFNFTQLMITGFTSESSSFFLPIAGDFFPLIPIFFFVGILYVIFIATEAKKGESAKIHKQVNWIYGSIVLGFLSGGGFFPDNIGLPIPSFIAVFATPIFVIGVFYAITKHKLFNIKIIATELLIFGMWGFLAFRAFSAKTTQDQLIGAVLLIVVVILGIFLIKSVIKEVTQRKELEKVTAKLKNLNENLEESVENRTKEIIRAKIHTDTIIKNLTLGLVEYDKDFNILQINISAENILGIHKENVLNEQILKNNTVEEFSSLVTVLHKGESKNKENLAQTYEISINYPKKKDLEIITTPIIYSKNTNEKSFVKLIRDITHEKQLQKAKGEFLTIAAHQLKTPLSGVKWMLGLSRSGDLDKLSVAKKKDFIDQAYTANEHMIKIVNNFLKIARMESGYYEYDFKKNDITKLVLEMVDLTKFTSRGKKLSITAELPKKILPKIVFDEQKMEMVLQNILENAIIYTPDGGSIVVKLAEKKGTISITITDTGVGIPKEEINQVFTKFFRSTKALHIETDHSGLGLFITKEIIEEHGGTIKVKSTEDKGTTITVSLPIDR